MGYCYLHGIKAYIIASGSMDPVLAIGSLVIVQPENSYYTGQVISYYKTVDTSGNLEKIQVDQSLGPINASNAEIIVTHRIVSILNQQGIAHYRTKGDVNSEPDQELVSHSRVIGRVVLVIPVIGYLFVLPQTKLGFYLIVETAVVWLCLLIIKKIFL